MTVSGLSGSRDGFGRIRVGFNARVLANPGTRGWTRYTSELLRALSNFDDLEMLLFTMEELQPEHLRGVRARVVRFGARRESMWSDWELPRVLREHGVDVFHAPADRGVPLIKPCPTVVTVHNSLERMRWREMFPSAKRRWWYWKNEIANWTADAVITVSETTRRDLVRLRAARRGRVHAIHSGVSAEFRATPTERDEEVLRRHGIKVPYVLYVGGYDHHKNVDTLVRAFDVAGLLDYELVVVARRDARFYELAEEWQRLECAQRLRFVEMEDEDVPAAYRQAMCFVNPSQSEAFSFQVVEAMASGTPLLVADGSAMPEIAAEACALFDPTDVPGLAHLMREISANGGLRAEMRERGLIRSMDFSWERTAEATMDVYRLVFANTRRRRRAARVGVGRHA